jgi:hypothetical protein
MSGPSNAGGHGDSGELGSIGLGIGGGFPRSMSQARTLEKRHGEPAQTGRSSGNYRDDSGDRGVRYSSGLRTGNFRHSLGRALANRSLGGFTHPAAWLRIELRRLHLVNSPRSLFGPDKRFWIVLGRYWPPPLFDRNDKTEPAEEEHAGGVGTPCVADPNLDG